ncbi:DUF5996 family protein [Tateyamaria sp. syn59]|uniref:DUF5996 family protein n=1 Tax=Tateyamaria sp. syn59 TaxID=2576942 RepID=UPI001CB89454
MPDPAPDGSTDALAGPEGAHSSKDLAEFLLPYQVVAVAHDPAVLLLAVLQAAYDAVARACRMCPVGSRAVLQVRRRPLCLQPRRASPQHPRQ